MTATRPGDQMRRRTTRPYWPLERMMSRIYYIISTQILLLSPVFLQVGQMELCGLKRVEISIEKVQSLHGFFIICPALCSALSPVPSPWRGQPGRRGCHRWWSSARSAVCCSAGPRPAPTPRRIVRKRTWRGWSSSVSEQTVSLLLGASSFPPHQV